MKILIDPRIKYIGISKLRRFLEIVGENFSKSDELFVIKRGEENIAVLVPYEMYMEIQSKINNE